MTPPFRILIVSNSVLSAQLQDSLHSNYYQIESVSTVKSGLEKYQKETFNLIICQDNIEKKSGFHVFKEVEDSLAKRNIAFFLLLDQFNRDDIQVGLELGIDNFIFSPIEKTSVRNKVEKLYQKNLHFNYYETPVFQEQFKNSPIPMFYSENSEIIKTNTAFSQFFGQKEVLRSKLFFNDLFDLNGNQQNHLNLRKLENGLIDHCWLDNVKCILYPQQKFCLYKSTLHGRKGNNLMTILMPQCMKHENGLENDCLTHCGCIKEESFIEKPRITNIHLTPRETEIFNLSTMGVPLKQIAAKLKLSQRTVEKHRSNIMQKTDTHSIMEAILEIKGVLHKS